MKKLILMRHGNADLHFNDWERPLTTKGQDEVRDVSSQILKHKDWLPSLVICSEAVRAKQSFQIFSNAYSDFKTVYVKTLYHGSMKDVVASIEQTEDSISNVMIIGHNPVLTELACKLSDDHVRLSTANAAMLSAKDEMSWGEMIWKTWNLERVLEPKV